MNFFSNCHQYLNRTLLPGDLVFFKPNALSVFFENFISAVSASYEVQIYHVAMITRWGDDGGEIIEATPNHGVAMHEYRDICDVSGMFGQIEIMRVNVEDPTKQEAVLRSIKTIGAAYNDIFSPDYLNSHHDYSFYCSQLIQYAYNSAAEREVFPSHPMHFADSMYWENYFSKLSLEIPEGANGTHPGSIYNSDYLTCIL